MEERTTLVAACGMNCGICLGYLREKNRCPGCRGGGAGAPSYCGRCIIRKCELLAATTSSFCYECAKYPCRRLKELDKRYRTKYGMSMLENLAFIRDNGLAAFVRKEGERWRCPSCGGVICVHRTHCLTCGAEVRTAPQQQHPQS